MFLFACIFILLHVIHHRPRNGALGMGGEVFFLSVYFSFMLTVDEILSILEDYNDMVDADIFMEPPENAEAREDKTFFLYMDNFFTSLPLFRRLKGKVMMQLVPYVRVA